MVSTQSSKTQKVLYPPVSLDPFYFPWSSRFPREISAQSPFVHKLGSAFIKKKLDRELVFKEGFREEKIQLVGDAFVPVPGACVIHLEIPLCRPCVRGEESEDRIIDWIQVVAACNLDREIGAVKCQVIDSLTREDAEKHLIPYVPEEEREMWTMFYAFDHVCAKGQPYIKIMAHFYSPKSKGKGFLNWYRRIVGEPAVVPVFKDRCHPYVVSKDNKICLL